MIVDLKLQVADNMKPQPVELSSHTSFPSLEEPECNILVSCNAPKTQYRVYMPFSSIVFPKKMCCKSNTSQKLSFG